MDDVTRHEKGAVACEGVAQGRAGDGCGAVQARAAGWGRRAARRKQTRHLHRSPGVPGLPSMMMARRARGLPLCLLRATAEKVLRESAEHGAGWGSAWVRAAFGSQALTSPTLDSAAAALTDRQVDYGMQRCSQSHDQGPPGQVARRPAGAPQREALLQQAVEQAEGRQVRLLLLQPNRADVKSHRQAGGEAPAERLAPGALLVPMSAGKGRAGGRQTARRQSQWSSISLPAIGALEEAGAAGGGGGGSMSRTVGTARWHHPSSFPCTSTPPWSREVSALLVVLAAG